MNDRRIIEEFLPVDRIGPEGSGTAGHISALHLWRARRPLVVSRAAVYAALDRSEAAGSPDDVERFFERLCQYPGSKAAIVEAADRIRAAYGRAPVVLDCFAGGGAIPLEAARLGCDTHAVDLNPVAHLIELATATFAQQFGTELADDVERWGKRVLDAVKAQVGHLYPNLPKGKRQDGAFGTSDVPIAAAYWTRTVPCRDCEAPVPLYRQTWLRKKASGYVALRPKRDRKRNRLAFEVVESSTTSGLGFDPSEGSKGSATVCGFCQSAADGKYVRQVGAEASYGQQLLCLIARHPEGPGKVYLAGDALAEGEEERQRAAAEIAREIEAELGPTSLDETILPTGNAGLATGKSYLHGIHTFRQMFTPRQLATLLAFAREIRRAHTAMLSDGVDAERAKAIATYLGLWLSRLTDRINTLARWNSARETAEGLTSMKRFAMMWDFVEVNPFGGASGDALGALRYVTEVIRREGEYRNPVTCRRATATELPFEDETFDAVVTDPPWYDNESYSELSDVCYVWLRAALGPIHPEHFASALTPKRKECVAAAYRQGGRAAAKTFFEENLSKAFAECQRVLRPGGVLVVMYAHKTASGWGTLVESLRAAGFEVTEAWPVETDTGARVAHRGDAALRSSLLIAGRKRAESPVGSYEDDVRPELESIVAERVDTLWERGLAGGDLAIAAIGAGLRSFTRFAEVELSSGEPVTAERFLTEVEGLVLERLLAKVFGTESVGVGGIDGRTRFYVLWRATHGGATMEAGEAIVFTYGQGVEIGDLETDGLVEKGKKGEAVVYTLHDFTDRGEDPDLGLGDEAPLIDALHRLLWLVENEPRGIRAFLEAAKPDLERLRLCAQVLAGTRLDGGSSRVATTSFESAALERLVTHWAAVIENRYRPAPAPAGADQGRLL